MTVPVQLAGDQCELVVMRYNADGDVVRTVHVFTGPARISYGDVRWTVAAGERFYVGPLEPHQQVEVVEKHGCKTCGGWRGHYEGPADPRDHVWVPCPDCGPWAGRNHV